MDHSQDAARLVKKQHTFLDILMAGKREMREEEAMYRAAKLGMEWLKPPFVVAIIAPVYPAGGSADPDAMLWSYETFVERELRRLGQNAACMTDFHCRVRVLLSLAGKEHRDTDLDELFIGLHEKLLTHFNMELFISIGSVVQSLNRVDVSCADANEMQAYKYQYASRGVSNIANRMRFEYARHVGNSISVERVIGCFHDGDLGKMSTRLDELIEQVRYRPGVSKTSIRRTMISLTISVLNIAANAGVDVDRALKGRDPYRWILDQKTTPVLTEWFMELCTCLLQEIQENRKTEEKQVIQMACSYVQENLHRNDLSLRQISTHVGLSSSYFSQMFKQETGEGINAYISRCRVERAKELLSGTELKNEDIALQLGFSSVSYFSTVFKNATGCSPAEFRRNPVDIPGKS